MNLEEKECNDFGYIRRQDNIYEDYFYKKDVKEAILRLKKEIKKQGWFCNNRIVDEIFGEELSSFDTTLHDEDKK